MYNKYFGFKESPFAIAPDPRYLYMTPQHREALAHLVYGLNSEGGCILLTGEVGTGKTTICRCLLEQIPSQANVALVLNPKVNEIELLETICDELKISYPSGENNSLKIYTDRIYTFLIERNRKNEKTVLIIDEAQNLDSKVLEQLRLLTNLETNQRKLLQIIILGQPELLDILARTEMRQLAQRITARFHLQPLTRQEMKAYISHRLAVAGQNIQLFPDNSIKLLFKLSKGVPRLINILCDRALLGTYVENDYVVKPHVVKKAAKEVFGELKNVEQHQKNKLWLYPLAIFSGISIIIIVAILLFTPSVNYDEILKETVVAKNVIDKPLVKPAQEATHQAIAMEVQPETIDTTDKKPEPEVEPVNETQQNDIPPVTATTKEYVDLEDILTDSTYDPASAYQQLFKQWDIPYESKSKTTACKQAEAYSLKCLYKHGNINSLKIHNRPAVLTLTNSQGKARHIAITSIDDSFATVYSNNNEHLIKLDDIDKYWYGQFILLWRKPDSYSSIITPGDRGKAISWLSGQFTQADDKQSSGMVSTYDAALVDKVKSFQVDHGLTADGIVGPITIIYLNAQSGMKTPSLAPLPITTANGHH